MQSFLIKNDPLQGIACFSIKTGRKVWMQEFTTREEMVGEVIFDRWDRYVAWKVSKITESSMIYKIMVYGLPNGQLLKTIDILNDTGYYWGTNVSSFTFSNNRSKLIWLQGGTYLEIKVLQLFPTIKKILQSLLHRQQINVALRTRLEHRLFAF